MVPKRFLHLAALLFTPFAFAQVQLQFAFPQFGGAIAAERFVPPNSIYSYSGVISLPD
jgi:hypothetical protein